MGARSHPARRPLDTGTGAVPVPGGRRGLGQAVAGRAAERASSTFVLAARRSAELHGVVERFDLPATVVVAFGVLGDEARDAVVEARGGGTVVEAPWWRRWCAGARPGAVRASPGVRPDAAA